jgi:hypothetical protein
VYSHILNQIRHAARAGRVYLTIHATKELKVEKLTYDDVINCLLTGEIVKDQYDPDVDETKYGLYGDSLSGEEMAVIAKLGYNHDAVIITAYRLQITDYE